MSSTMAQVDVGRKYKSRKERPCDACRKRKICCTRDAFEIACSLCKTRRDTCKYVLPPNARKNRRVAASSGSSPGSPASTASVQYQNLNSRPGESLPSRPRNVGPTEWSCQFVGFSGDQDPFVLRHCSFNQLNCYKASDSAILRIKGADDIPVHFNIVPDDHLAARPDYYPRTDTEAIIYPHSQELIRIYFDTVHASYPLLDPSRLNSPPHSSDPLIATIYNLSIPFHRNTPTHLSLPLTNFINQVLPIDLNHPRLETLEASLLHLQRLPPPHLTQLPGLHTTSGSLIGLAHDLGLNLDPTAWSLTPSDSSRRIRIWWFLYVQDKWLALTLGRPSYLHDENHDVPLPTLSNFHPSDSTAALQFIAMAKLTTILSETLSTFYTLKAMQQIKLLPISTLLSIHASLQAQIQGFHQQYLLPIHNTPNSGNLILAYHTCNIVLYRAILRNLPMSDPEYGRIKYQARETLLQVVEFVENLTTPHLQVFWWNSITPPLLSLLSTNMFYQLLTSITSPDVEFWTTQISIYRTLLHSKSKQFHILRLASERMDKLAEGMRGGGEGEGDIFKGGSVEEWIVGKGHGGLLVC